MIKERYAGMSRGAVNYCCALFLVLGCSSPSRVVRDVVLTVEVKILSPSSILRREVLPERRPITRARVLKW